MAVLPENHHEETVESFSTIGMIAQQTCNIKKPKTIIIVRRKNGNKYGITVITLGHDLTGKRLYFQLIDSEFLYG